jgi:hypothetical protein
MDIDPTDQTYDVFVTPDGGDQMMLADDYAFRSEQADTGLLDSWSVRSLQGGMTVENVQVVPEPSAFALVACGSVLLFRRRRAAV